MRTIEEMPTLNPFNDKSEGRIIGWISGGVASAVACHKAMEHYGKERVELVFCDTSWESKDTFRFMKDLEDFWGKEIKILKSEKFNNPLEVWKKYKGMNFAHGAPCSNELKKQPRIEYQRTFTDFAQVFGFDYDKHTGGRELKRARNMLNNNPEINPIFPLVFNKMDRVSIFYELKRMGIKAPEAYDQFLNNNCIGELGEGGEGLGCIQGGIGYWQKIKELYPKKFEKMAKIEHEISHLRGKPVTICKNQEKGAEPRLFLKKCEEFPHIKTIDIIKGRIPVAFFECNGFCSTEN